jgi:exopolysaccharide production protein ExoQ
MQSLALLACTLFVAFLFYRDPARDPKVSAALWIPLIWIAIVASRLPSQWLGVQGVQTQAYQDGNPLDRMVYLTLLFLGVCVLMSRSVRWGGLIKENFALSLLILLGLFSVVWSDFPFVSFKRWIRDLGAYMMLVLVLSEARPLEAVEALIRRLCYALIPFSILMIRYYPDFGRSYSGWTGEVSYTGVTNNKNLLGVLCLVSGLFFFWDFLKRWADRHDRTTRRILFVDVVLGAMTLWLLSIARSSTSTLCLAVGVLIIGMARTNFIARYPARLKHIVITTAIAYLVFDSIFDIKGIVTGMVGRDASFTGRVNVWEYLVNRDQNWLLGVGYESFWLGPRLLEMWTVFPFGPNQAHNGYIEMYINLGLVGVFLLLLVLFSSYRKIGKGLDKSEGFAVLSFSLWITLLLYNITEAAFKVHLIWLVFLLAAITVPKRAQQPNALRVKPRIGVARREYYRDERIGTKA